MMKSFPLFLTCTIVAIWVVAIAILSVQNATPVSLTFLVLRSIEIPLGVVLGISVGVGLIGGAVVSRLQSKSVFK